MQRRTLMSCRRRCPYASHMPASTQERRHADAERRLDPYRISGDTVVFPSTRSESVARRKPNYLGGGDRQASCALASGEVTSRHRPVNEALYAGEV